MPEYSSSYSSKSYASSASASSYALLTKSQQSAAIAYNRRNNQSICRRIQSLVGTAVDGSFGPNTVNAIAAWQSRNGLAADGQFGPASKSKAGFNKSNSGGGSSHSSSSGSSARLTKSQQNAAIAYNNRVNQGICRRIQGLVGTAVDGSFGPNTVNAIAAWQAANGLVPDGQFGPASKKKAGFDKPAAGGGNQKPAAQKPSNKVKLTAQQQSTAISYNRSYNQGICRQIQKIVGTTVDGSFGPNTVNAIANWQAVNGLVVDGQFGPASKKKAGIKENAGGQGGKGLNANQRLSNNSIQVARELNTVGWCAKGVSTAVSRTYGIYPGGNGNTIGRNLPTQYFRPTNATLNECLNVPGIVLTWQSTNTKAGSKYGHTAITVGNGQSSTCDFYENNTRGWSPGHRWGFQAYTTY